MEYTNFTGPDWQVFIKFLALIGLPLLGIVGLLLAYVFRDDTSFSKTLARASLFALVMAFLVLVGPAVIATVFLGIGFVVLVVWGIKHSVS